MRKIPSGQRTEDIDGIGILAEDRRVFKGVKKSS